MHAQLLTRTKKPSYHSLRRYNWLPDNPDHRDFMFVERMGAPGALPEKIDLRSLCAPVANQGKIGSCTGNAIAGLLEFLELAELKSNANAAEVFLPNKYENISRLFIYYNERLLSHTTDYDSGATLRNGMKTLAKFGVCREHVWSYEAAHVLQKPNSQAYKEATKHKISAYLRVTDLNAGLKCLAAGYPFVFGFTVFESFESAEVAKTGMVPLPNDNEQVIGGHAVMAAGYDLEKQCLIVRNSWGDSWGDNGYFYLPFAYITNLKLAQDFWTIRK